MTVRVGIIGAGAFGREHARAYARIPNARLVSVTDTDPERARALAEEFGIPQEAEPDAVSLVVPVSSRGSLVSDLLDRPTAVLIEKPLAASAAEARDIARRASDRAVMVGHVLRFAEPYVGLARRAREWGGLAGGTLTRVRSSAHAARHPHDDVIGLTMIHDLDAAAWLADSAIVTVAADGVRGADGRWTVCEATLTAADGSRWFVGARWTGEDADQHDDASVTSDDGRTASLAIGSADTHVYTDALHAELAHFVACARDGAPSPRLVLEDAARAVSVADAVRRSLDLQGVVIDVP